MSIFWNITYFLIVTIWVFGSSPMSAAPDITLTYPTCHPTCDADQQKALLKEGLTEKIVVDAISKAEREIRFSIYTFSRGPIFKALIDAAADRGVVVRGLVDRAQLESLKPTCDEAGCHLESLILDEGFASLPLRDRMNRIKDLEIYKKATLVGKLHLLSYKNEDKIHIKVGAGQSRLMHNKFLIVDDQLVQTSSGNWSSTAMSVNFENVIQFTSADHQDEVNSFICAFEAIWNEPSASLGTRLQSCALPGKLFFTPASGGSEAITETILTQIKNAQVSIDISMHHLAHPKVYQALIDAGGRGVAIRLLFDDDDCLNKTPTPLHTLLHVPQSQVKVHYMPTNCAINQLSHNRFGIFDQKLVINGSANWSQAGLKSNYESFVQFDDQTSVDSFRDYYDRLFQAGVPKNACGCDLKLEECRKRYCRGEFSPKF
jgi:phosphatidylserine/phosphatidylglycerophosphate/cardiolipin synthase-like enzyme